MQVSLYNVTICVGMAGGGVVASEMLYLHGDVQ